MSLSNDQISAKNFKKFLSAILPYMGGGVSDFDSLSNRPEVGVDSMSEVVTPLPEGNPASNYVPNTGFTPVGTIISVMGTNAPTHYIACNGQIVNIIDYPVLAKYFENQFGTKNHFGGDGTTTFGIPDLRGEFLRGTGTNGHTDQGNGSDVGVHQDGTRTLTLNCAYDGQLSYCCPSSENLITSDKDNTIKSDRLGYIMGGSHGQSSNSSNEVGMYTSRPTNTSVLYCIATKNIYIDAKQNYSTDEQVVGTWIDGKPIYQKVVDLGSIINISSDDWYNTNISYGNADKVINSFGLSGGGSSTNTNATVPIRVFAEPNTNENWNIKSSSGIAAMRYFCVQYTKTTD